VTRCCRPQAFVEFISLHLSGGKHFTALSKVSFEARDILQQTPRD